MTKTRYRVVALIAAAALSLGACTNNNADESPNAGEPTAPATTEPIEDPTEDPTEEPTVEPTEDPTDEPTDPEPADDRPTNSAVEQIGMDQCMPMLMAMAEVGGHASSLDDFSDPAGMVEGYQEVARLLDSIEPMPGMEGDLWVVQEFFGAYAENLDDSITTETEAQTAMLGVLSSLTQRGLTINSGVESMDNIALWVEDACAP